MRSREMGSIFYVRINVYRIVFVCFSTDAVTEKENMYLIIKIS